MMNTRVLLIGAIASVVAWLGTLGTKRISPAYPQIAARIEKEIRLTAGEGSPTTGLATPEPIRGGRGEGLNGLRQSFAAWLVTGFLLALLGTAILRWLERHDWVEPHWHPLLAGAGVAV